MEQMLETTASTLTPVAALVTSLFRCVLQNPIYVLLLGPLYFPVFRYAFGVSSVSCVQNSAAKYDAPTCNAPAG